MASTSVLSPPLPASSSSWRLFRLAAIVLAVIAVSITAFGIAWSVRDHRTASHAPAATTHAPVPVEAAGSTAQLEALLSTPQGLAAFQAQLAREFAPGSFGAHPGSSTPTDEATAQAQLAHEFAPGSFGARPGPTTPANNCPAGSGSC